MNKEDAAGCNENYHPSVEIDHYWEMSSFLYRIPIELLDKIFFLALVQSRNTFPKHLCLTFQKIFTNILYSNIST